MQLHLCFSARFLTFLSRTPGKGAGGGQEIEKAVNITNPALIQHTSAFRIKNDLFQARTHTFTSICFREQKCGILPRYKIEACLVGIFLHSVTRMTRFQLIPHVDNVSFQYDTPHYLPEIFFTFYLWRAKMF